MPRHFLLENFSIQDFACLADRAYDTPSVSMPVGVKSLETKRFHDIKFTYYRYTYLGISVNILGARGSDEAENWARDAVYLVEKQPIYQNQYF